MTDTMFNISWNSHLERLDSLDAVDSLLDHLHQQFRNSEPTLVTVERGDTGDSLSIGLGSELSVLSYVRGDMDPPYYTASGGSEVDEAISFLFGGEWSEFPLRNAIPVSAARTAMKEFCESGKLAENVQWEEV